MKSDQSVLIVEDDHETNHNFQMILRSYFDDVCGAHNTADGWKMYEKHHPDAMLIDIEMGGTNGLDLVRRIRAVDPKCFIGVITAFSNQRYLEQAVTLKLDAYIVKPLTEETLLSLVTRIRESNTLKAFEAIVIDHETVYDIKAKHIVRNNQRIVLTHLEIILLELLIASRGEIVDYQTIEENLYSSDDASRNGLRILVARLRKKLPGITIRSIANIGYILT